MYPSKLGYVVRSFSTSSACAQLIKPKLQSHGLNGIYAMSLFSAATKKKVLPQVEKDLTEVNNLMKTDLVFRQFLLNPLLGKPLKKSALASVAQKKKMDPMTVNLLDLMIENGRVKNIEALSNLFSIIMAAEREELNCEVTVAKEMDAASRKELDTVLKSFAKKGEAIKLTVKVDSDIIGGMLVSIGDKFVDMSIASKVKMYTELMQQSV